MRCIDCIYEDFKTIDSIGLLLSFLISDMADVQFLSNNYKVVQLHPSSGVVDRPEWIIFHEFVLTSKFFIKYVLNLSFKFQVL